RTDRYVFADRLDERRIWRCGLTFIAPPHQHLRTAESCVRSGLFGETGLADPRLAGDHNQRRLPAESGIDSRAHRGHLLGPADELCPCQATRCGLMPDVFELTPCGRWVELLCKSGFRAARRLLGIFPIRCAGCLWGTWVRWPVVVSLIRCHRPLFREDALKRSV